LWQVGKLTDLGTLGGPTSGVRGMNGLGQVVGVSATRSGAEHAFLWQKGKLTDMGTLAGLENSEPSDINERGQVVGWSQSKTGEERAFLWQKGRMTALGTLGGKWSLAHAINDRGQIVGQSLTNLSVSLENGDVITARHAFLWQNGKLTDLGTLPHHQSGSWALAINNRGQIVGAARWESGGNLEEHRPFLWQNGKLTDLGTLTARPGELQTGTGLNSAVAINERGQVTGTCETVDQTHGVLWQNGRLIDLGTLGTNNGNGFVANINGRRQIVGARQAENGTQHAFLWQNGKMTDLGTLPGGDKSYANAINNHGQIVGASTTRTGQTHAVLWTLRDG
jgi:probable HAF family extracellular repeat protein